MQNEIHRLYVQKTNKEPDGELKAFIESLTVREVARIWSMMGDGGDFIKALQKVVALKISKMSDGQVTDSGDKDLDQMLKELNQQKLKQEKDKELAAQKAEKAEKERQEAEARLQKEREQAEIAEKQRLEAEKRAEEERKVAEEAAQAKVEADLKAAAAAEEERKAAELAAKAASEEREAAEAAMRKAQQELADLRKQAEEAERRQKEADEKAAAERAEAERRDVLKQAADERAAEERRLAAQAEKEKRQAERKQKQIEEQQRVEEEEAEEELKDETVRITLNAPGESLGLGCLAGAGRVRIIDVTGASERAGVKSASVLLKVDGRTVDSQETLIESVEAIRNEQKTEFDILIQPPLYVSEEDKEILRQYTKHQEEVKQWLERVEQCKTVTIEMTLHQAIDLVDKGSHRPFCEVKLREVVNGVVGTGHKNPQKVQTKAVECKSKDKKLSNAKWDEKFRFEVPKQDCIRVSLFGAKLLKKDYLGRVDLILPELLEELCSEPIIARWPIQGDGEGRGKVEGELELGLWLVACDGDTGEK